MFFFTLYSLGYVCSGVYAEERPAHPPQQYHCDPTIYIFWILSIFLNLFFFFEFSSFHLLSNRTHTNIHTQREQREHSERDIFFVFWLWTKGLCWGMIPLSLPSNWSALISFFFLTWVFLIILGSGKYFIDGWVRVSLYVSNLFTRDNASTKAAIKRGLFFTHTCTCYNLCENYIKDISISMNFFSPYSRW